MPPALPPVTTGIRLNPGGKEVTIDLFLDYVCPYSTKMFKAVDALIEQNGAQGVSFTVHAVPQPFHPQGVMIHEAVLALNQVSPASYKPFARAVIAAYEDGRLTTDATWNKSRGQLNEELASMVSTVCGDVTADSVRKLLAMDKNGNNAMLQPLKWLTKFYRARGVHVTPTVHVNGLEATLVSSSWTTEQWAAFLEPMGSDLFQGSKLP